MMKEYRSMEAYKVSFNANEQVAAACEIWVANGKMTTNLNGTDIPFCAEVNGKYGAGDLAGGPLDFLASACLADDNGKVDGSATVQYT